MTSGNTNSIMVCIGCMRNEYMHRRHFRHFGKCDAHRAGQPCRDLVMMRGEDLLQVPRYP